MATTEPLTIRLIGRPALVDRQGEVLLTPKLAQLLAYLALCPTRSESREQLARLLWGERSQARANLRQLLRRTRNELGGSSELFVPDSKLVSLSAFGPVIDLDLLSEALDEDAAAAINIGSAPLLADIEETTTEFEEWLRAARSALAARLEACAERILRAPHAHPLNTLVAAAAYLAKVESGGGSHRLAVEAFARVGRPDLARLYGKVPARAAAPETPPPSREPLRLGFKSIDCTLQSDTSLPLRAFVEDCADRLASYRSFTVLAPHSTLRLDAPCTELAVTGRLAPGEDGPVLALRLETAEGAILWAGRFAADERALIGSATRLVRLVATQLGDAVEAHVGEHARVTGRPEAYAVYLAGREAARVLSLPNLRRARRAYSEAARADASMAAPLARLAETLYIEWALRGGTEPDLLDQAAQQAEQARRADPGASVGHWISGAVALYRGETDRVLDHYDDAEVLAPNCADLLLEHADALSHLERHDAARVRFLRALDLNPIPPDRYWWIGASIAFGDQDFEAAAEFCDRIASQETAVALRAASYAMAGRMEQARDWGLRARETLPSASVDDLVRLAPNPTGGRKEKDYRAGLALAGFD